MDIDQIELTISIVNTNHKDLLRSLLTSIYENTKRTRFEVIVADNCSTDGSAEMVKAEFPDVRVILNESRKGFGFSQNRAFEKSKGRYFLVLNEDMVVLSDAIDAMVDRIKQDKGIGALGCRLVNRDGSLQVSCDQFPTLFSVIYENLFPYNFIFPKSKFRARLFYWDHQEEREVDVILGCCMLIPREVIEKIGLFDEQFVLFSDEVDLCKRIREAGWKILFTPNAVLVHYYGATVNYMGRMNYFTLLESKIKYFKKHHGKLQANLVKLAFIFGTGLRLFGWSTVRIVEPRKRQLAKEKLEFHCEVFRWLLKLGRK